MTILQDQTKPTYDQLFAMLQDAKAKLSEAKSSGNGFKVTAKGGISMYGLGRFPVTLYKSQWLNLKDRIPGLMDFIAANDDKLAVKE